MRQRPRLNLKPKKPPALKMKLKRCVKICNGCKPGFVNYRRRVERDRDVAKDNATFAMLEALLPVIDDIDAAHDAGDLDGPFAAISRKLISTLESFGLVKHDAETLVGEPFDPVHHEAMLRQPSSEIAEEHIVQVFPQRLPVQRTGAPRPK